MTAKEKAKELFDRFYDKIEDIKVECNQYCHGGSISKKEPARQCALIAVDEILETGNDAPQWGDERITFWSDVKLEIEKL